MGYSSWPSSGYNGGAVTDDEYERLTVGGSMHSSLEGLPTDDPIAYADGSGMAVKLRPNRAAWVRGMRFQTDGSTTSIAIASNSGSTRYDLITLRLDGGAVGGPTVTPHVIQGTSGGGVPSPVRNDFGSGVWDFDVAVVTVAHGVTSIAGSAVAPRGVYAGEPTYLCTTATRPGQRPGRTIFDTDTGQFLVSNGTKWVGASDDTDWDDLPLVSGSGWGVSALRHRRLNGWESIMINVVRTGADLAANTDSDICVLPSGHRPGYIWHVDGDVTNDQGVNTARAKIDSSTGLLTLQTYSLLRVTGSGSTAKLQTGGALTKGLSFIAETSYPIG